MVVLHLIVDCKRRLLRSSGEPESQRREEWIPGERFLSVLGKGGTILYMAQSVLGTTVTPNLFLSGFGSNTRNVNDRLRSRSRPRTRSIDWPFVNRNPHSRRRHVASPRLRTRGQSTNFFGLGQTRGSIQGRDFSSNAIVILLIIWLQGVINLEAVCNVGPM